MTIIVAKSPYHSKSAILVNEKRKLAKSPVAVEKLFRTKIAKTKLRQDEL
jgi:hypothetical protein